MATPTGATFTPLAQELANILPPAPPLSQIQPSRAKTLRVTSRRARTVKASRSYPISELDVLYEGISGFHANTTALSGTHPTTYGEITTSGIELLSTLFQSRAPAHGFPRGQRTFYDLGCGAGRVVHGMALLNPAVTCHGIEIVPDRVMFALTAKSRIQHRELFRRVSFDLLSVLDQNVSLGDACWIFISNLCFPEDLARNLTRKLEAELSPGCIVACSRALLVSPGSSLTEIGNSIPIPMTWDAGSKVYLYKKGASAAL